MPDPIPMCNLWHKAWLQSCKERPLVIHTPIPSHFLHWKNNTTTCKSQKTNNNRILNVSVYTWLSCVQLRRTYLQLAPNFMYARTYMSCHVKLGNNVTVAYLWGSTLRNDPGQAQTYLCHQAVEFGTDIKLGSKWQAMRCTGPCSGP